MLTTKFLLSKAKSKKGFTLVEALCACFVLAIVFVGVLNAVAFSKQMVLTDTARERASDKAQLIADEVFSAATGYPVTDPVSDLVTKLVNIVNNNSDPQTDPIGKVAFKSKSEGFTALDHMTAAQPQIECIIDPITTAADEAKADGTVSRQEVVELGWDIKVRVYYKEIQDSDKYLCVDVSAFAPSTYIPD